MGLHDVRLSRRAALQGFAGLVIAAQLPLGPKIARAQGAAAPFEANAFVRVGTDDIVTVLVKHIEFGQGPFTGLATLVAEEMDADWSQVRSEHAPANAALYGSINFGGMQGTGGSSAMASSFDLMRQAGAAARAMLVAAAADEWQVPAAEITVSKGVLSHVSGKQATFGQLAAKAAGMPPVDAKSIKLKDASTFTMIGKDLGQGQVRRIDSAAKTNGTAMFTIDIREEGMLTVAVARSPRFGGKLASFDDAAARQIKGVVDVKPIPSGVAVYATSTWPAIKGRDALKVSWDDNGAERRSSDQMMEEFRAQSRSMGQVIAQSGDPDAALAGAESVIESEYVFPYLAHAPMEPLDGFLRWDGQTAVARFGCQMPTLDQMAIGRVLGLGPDKVFIETMLAGGSFGRRAQATCELATELAEIAKAIGPGKPVKLVRTREDDLHGGYYRPMYVHRLRGGIKDGKIVAWTGTVVGQSIMEGTPFGAMMAGRGYDPTSVEGANETPYDIADFRCDLHTMASAVPVLWWRSVGHTHTGYAVECFIDELLQATNQDPVEGRLAMMGKHPRAAGVLKAVSEMAGWSGPNVADGRARGVAVVESFGSFVAQIAEVSVGNGGLPKVHKVWCAVDCGIAVNPDVIRAQMEGGIGYGLGHALYAEVSLKDGIVTQTNFNNYRSLRIHEMPAVEVKIVPSTEKPTGVGEPGVPTIAPAVANAMARLGMGRPKRMPFVGGFV